MRLRLERGDGAAGRACRAGKRTLLVAALILTPPAGAGEARGPLAVADLFPLRHGFLQFTPEAVEPVGAGQWRLGLQFSIANTLVRADRVEVVLEGRVGRETPTANFLRRLDDGSGIFLVDSEDRVLRLRLERGLRGGWQVGFEVPLIERGGGSLDGFGESFHSLLGVDQDGRLGLTKDRLFIYIAGNPSELLLDEAPGSGLGDAAFTAKRSLPASGPWRWAVDTALKLPTGDEKRLMSSGSADLGVRALASRALAPRWHVHLGAGASYLGRWDLLRTPDQARWNGFAAIERSSARAASAVLQLVGCQSPLDSLGVAELDEDSFQLTLGGHVTLTPGQRLTVAATENVVHFDSGSDFSFHLGISTSLR